MNQQCKVCGEPAAGFHFGAFTCEGCKSFFGRTYNNLGSISECKNGGVCVINKKNRTACKACRLRKCLMVGMSKSGSRYGRRSNWFKIHCLLQEQTNNNQSPGGLAASHFGAGFLPGFLPGLQAQQQGQHQNHLVHGYGQHPSPGGGVGGKDPGREQGSPSQEDLALQSHLLHVAMLKQQQHQHQQHQHQHAKSSAKSPRPDLPGSLKLLAWPQSASSKSSGDEEHQQQNHQRQHSPVQPQPQHSPTQAQPHSQQPQQQQPQIFGSNPLDGVFRPFMPLYKRAATSPNRSDSGASSVETGDERDEPSRCASAFGYHLSGSNRAQIQPQHQPHRQPAQVQPSFPRRKVNATVTFAADYLAHHRHHLHQSIYPPAGLVTPAAAQHALRGGDLLLASPSPGGLAVEQLEPIDLSLKSASRRQRRRRRRRQRQRQPRSDEDEEEEDDDEDEDGEDGEGDEGDLEDDEEDAERDADDGAARDSGSECGSGSKPSTPEATPKSNPLDLSVESVKRPTAEVSL